MQGGRPSDRISVAIVDPQPLFRAGVIHSLRALKAIESYLEGQSPADALRLASAHQVDLLIIDAAAPGGAMDAIGAITRTWPATRVVVLTASESVADVTAALKSGARGYILKHVSGIELFNALKAILSGDVYLSPSLGARLVANTGATGRARESLQDLTPREDQILARVSVGATNKEIARSMNITEKTVKYYMTNIMQKLQVRNRVEAVVVARKRNGAA